MMRQAKFVPGLARLARGPVVIQRPFAFSNDQKEDAKKKVVEAVETAKQKIKDLQEDPTVQKLAEKAKEAAQNIRENPTVNKVAEKVKEGAEALKDKAKDALNDLRQSDTVRQAEAKAEELKDRAQDKIDEYLLESPEVYSSQTFTRDLHQPLYIRASLPLATFGLFYINQKLLGALTLGMTLANEFVLRSFEYQKQRTIKSISYDPNSRTYKLNLVNGQTIDNIAFKDFKYTLYNQQTNQTIGKVKIGDKKEEYNLLIVADQDKSKSKGFLKAALSNDYKEIQKYWYGDSKANEQQNKNN